MRPIDADALYKTLNDIRKKEVSLHGRLNNKDCCTLSTALYEIECAPTIEPEREKGKWVDNTYCSECGWVHETDPGFIGSVDGFNFCPRCGADMREDK